MTWYEDKETGKTLSRKGFAQIQKAIFAGEIKTLVVWKLDRSRELKEQGLNNVEVAGAIGVTRQTVAKYLAEAS